MSQPYLTKVDDAYYIVGNRFLIDLAKRVISFHCKSTMRLFMASHPEIRLDDIPYKDRARLGLPLLTNGDRADIANAIKVLTGECTVVDKPLGDDLSEW